MEAAPLKAEIDTAPPFESVKAAVNLFDEKADLKALKFPSAEKRASIELQQLRENLAATKKQLAQAQTARSELLLELLETKRLVEKKTTELSKAFPFTEVEEETHGSPPKGPLTGTFVKEDHGHEQVHAVEEKVHSTIPTSGVPDLVAEKKEEPVVSEATEAKKETAENGETDQLLKVAENVDEFKASVQDIQVGTRGSTPGHSEGHSTGDSQEGSWLVSENGTLDEIKDLAPMDLHMEIHATIEHLKLQLKATKGSQEKLASECAEAQAELQKVKAELEAAQAAEKKAREAEQAVAQELSVLNARLNSLEEEKNALSAAAESLRDELSKVKMELAALSEVEAENYETSAELERVKADLDAVLAAESKAKEAVAGITQALHAVTKEADEAKAAAEMALEEAHNARVEAEQAKAHLLTAESRLEAATREAQAAKASENMVTEELKSLSERAAAVNTEEKKALQEHLAKRLQEAEELANMKVAAAVAQVEAAKASEHEVKTKLDAALLEVETNKSLAKQAVHRAETAEAAKSAVENELRRRRKAAELATTKGSGSPFYGTVQTPDRRVEPPLAHTMHRRSLDGYVSADVSTDSIAELLQLKPPASQGSMSSVTKFEKNYQQQRQQQQQHQYQQQYHQQHQQHQQQHQHHQHNHQEQQQPQPQQQQLKKKSSFIPRLGSYLSRKKSSVSSSNA